MMINKNIFKLIFASEFKKISFMLILMWFFFSILELIGIATIPLILSLFLDNSQIYQIPILHNFYNNFKFQNDTEYLKNFFFLVIFVFFLKNLFFIFLVFVETKIYKNISLNIKKKIFKYYFNLSFEEQLKQNSSDIIRKITLDTSNAVTYLISFLTLISQIILFSVIIFFLFYSNFLATFIVLSFFITVFSIIYLFSNNRLVRIGKEKQLKAGEILKLITEGIHSIKEVILYNKKSFLYSIFSIKQGLLQDKIMKITILKRIPKSIYEFMSVVAISLLMFFLINNTSIEDSLIFVSLFVISLIRLLPSVNLCTLSISNMKSTEYSFQLIYEKLNLKKNYFFNDSNSKKLIFNEKIDFKNVKFFYDNNKVFDNLNFSITKNSIVGIFGESGSGKSTLINLLCGLLSAKNGEILIDNKNINEIKKLWQSNIGYIPQDVYMLDDTIRNNIIFNDKKENLNSQKRLDKIINISELDTLVKSLDNGLDARVGDRGMNISGGQRQRIAIARALYHDPDLIIFDEATNSLDEKTEKNLLESIYSIKKKTLVIISHNIKTLNKCDKIYKIENKSIKEMKKF